MRSLQKGGPPVRAFGSGTDHERGLVHRIASNDRAALEELYRLYHRRLARFLTRLTPSYEVAEEIINDTFWVVWRKAADFRGDSQPSTWILGIAYRKARNAFRCSARLAAQQALEPPDPCHAPHEPQSVVELHNWLGHALLQLPFEQRLSVLACYTLGFSCEEIAAHMDCPTNTVKTRLFHARAKLQQLLHESAGEDDIPRASTRRTARLKSGT